MGLCHFDIMHPQVTDGRDNLQIWRVDVNILNQQSWTVSKGFCPAWGLGEGLAFSYSG